jgi:hypothetical protein
VETPDGHKIYWPSKGTVTIERDVRFNDETTFAGEKDEGEIPVPGSDEKGEKPAQQRSARTSEPNTSTPTPPASNERTASQGELPDSPTTHPTTPPHENSTFRAEDIAPDIPDAVDTSDAASNVGEEPSRRFRKPSAYICRLQAGEGVTSGGGGNSRMYTQHLQVPNDDANSRASIAYAAAVVPRSFRQAQKSEIWPEWDAAMKQEVSGLASHNTYSIMTRNETRAAPVLPHGWVFANKTDETGEVKQHKARICVRGDLQDSLGFQVETFAPVLKPTSRNILLAVAAHHSWHVRQCDFKSAYLNGVLPEPIYVEQPEGFDSPEAPRATHVWKLHKALYGLKEAGEGDHAVFYHKTETEHTFIGIHINDPITTGDNLDALVKLEADLNNKFPLKINGDATHYLGLAIQQDRVAGTIALSQVSYIPDLVALTGQENAKAVSSPLARTLRTSRSRILSNH